MEFVNSFTGGQKSKSFLIKNLHIRPTENAIPKNAIINFCLKIP